jgi:hypothetical protein
VKKRAGGCAALPRAAAAPQPAPVPAPPAGVTYYANCDAVRAAGAAPIHRGDPGYASELDRDGDGIGCEWSSHGPGARRAVRGLFVVMSACAGFVHDVAQDRNANGWADRCRPLVAAQTLAGAA